MFWCSMHADCRANFNFCVPRPASANQRSIDKILKITLEKLAATESNPSPSSNHTKVKSLKSKSYLVTGLNGLQLQLLLVLLSLY